METGTDGAVERGQNRDLRSFVALARDLREQLELNPCELGLLEDLETLEVSTEGDVTRRGEALWAARSNSQDERVVWLRAGVDAFEQEQFVAGWRICAELGGEGIPSVLEVGLNDSCGGVVAVIAGSPLRTLEAWLADESVDRRERLPWFLRLCRVVAKVHEAGVAHLELNPISILLDDTGGPFLCGWDRARVLEEHCQSDGLLRFSRSCPDLEEGVLGGYLRGAVGYLAPEQAVGDYSAYFDCRTDIFLLGTILYEILMGRKLVASVSLDAYSTALANGDFDWSSPASKEAPNDALLAVCRRALSPIPENRYADAGALAAALDGMTIEGEKKSGIIAGLKSLWQSS